MSSIDYEYRPLPDPAKEVRLLHLLPGQPLDVIRLRITLASVKRPATPAEADSRIQRIRGTLPSQWEAHETLGNRILYVDKSKELADGTSWEHPDPAYAPLVNPTAKQEDPAAVPEFEALSYVWGASQPAKEVYVETPSSTTSPPLAKLLVVQNLHDALRRLRRTDAERTIWVDAISINQADLAERSQQVARMRDIFSLARRVVIWLGRGTDDRHKGMTALEYLGRQVVTTVDRRIFPAPDSTEKSWHELTYSLPLHDDLWAQIGAILSLPWFERLWVVQELHLARQAVFLCGDVEVDWLHLRDAILLFWYNKEALYNLPPGKLRLAAQLAECIPEKHPISDTVAQVYGRLCAEGHDRVYGIHGLFPPSFSELVITNYQVPVIATWQDFIATHVAYSQRLEMLRLCDSHHRTTLRRPSWVPDLCHPLKFSRRMEWQFAAGWSRAEAVYDRAAATLEVTGVQCATVTTSEFLPEGRPLLESLAAVRAWQPPDLDSGTYPTGDSVRDALARTFIGNSLRDRIPQRLIDATLEDWRAQDSPTALFGAATAEPLPPDANLNGQEKAALSFLTGRCFFTTSEGYFGLGPSGTCPGDLVCVLLGCEAPMMLRRLVNDTFQVIGECFVYGLHDAIALLGHFPSPWISQAYHDSTGLVTELRFFNPETNTVTTDDPRLEALPEDWERSHRERTSGDPRYFHCLRNKKTGEEMKSDPRLSPDSLKARGVGLRKFLLS